MSRYVVKAVSSDVFGVVAGAGWVITEHGERIDWPMLSTELEALADVKEFRRAERQLACDEASEAHGLRYMGA